MHERHVVSVWIQIKFRLCFRLQPRILVRHRTITMHRVRCAFDPLQLANPTKVFPRPRLCGEKPGEYHPHPLETAGIAERF